MKVFRENIFSMADRKQIPTLIYKILEAELQEEAASKEGETHEALRQEDFKDMLLKKYD